MNSFAIEPLGERALLLRFGERPDYANNAHVRRLYESLHADPHPHALDLVPAYASLAVHFATTATPAATRQALRHWLQRHAEICLEKDGSAALPEARLIEIPVRYGGADGPDLADIARHAGLSEAEVVARHSGVEYRVGAIGFAPGFPYLLGLDPALAMPRLSAPRPCVAAGSVGIAQAQTGIYPQASPGGWRLLGRTALTLFDPSRTPPALLQIGDRVRFVAMD